MSWKNRQAENVHPKYDLMLIIIPLRLIIFIYMLFQSIRLLFQYFHIISILFQEVCNSHKPNFAHRSIRTVGCPVIVCSGVYMLQTEMACNVPYIPFATLKDGSGLFNVRPLHWWGVSTTDPESNHKIPSAICHFCRKMVHLCWNRLDTSGKCLVPSLVPIYGAEVGNVCGVLLIALNVFVSSNDHPVWAACHNVPVTRINQSSPSWLVVSSILNFPFHIWDVILPIDSYVSRWLKPPSS